MNDGTAAFPPQVGIGYDAFWLRDYEYTLTGSIDAYSDEELTRLPAIRSQLASGRSQGSTTDRTRLTMKQRTRG